jgi:hypothetical protein
VDSLDTIALRHGTDKASGKHGFAAIYEPLFAPFRSRPITLLEIGVETGASLRTWEDYFPEASIIGVDVNPAAVAHESDRISVMVGDQADREFLLRVSLRGPFDIAIDDGGHFPDQQLTSLLTLWPHVIPGGIYAVEDIHTSYLEDWRGGWRRERTMVEVMKEIVDDVNEPWHHQPVMLQDLASLHVHRELALFVKEAHGAPLIETHERL